MAPRLSRCIERGAARAPVGFTLPWSDVSQRTCRAGLWTSSCGCLPEKSGARIVARLVMRRCAERGAAPGGAPSARADQGATRRRGSARCSDSGQVGRLRKARFQLQQRHASAARARTEREVASFRSSSRRLHAARRGRERAMADFNRRQERAVSSTCRELRPDLRARAAPAIALEEAARASAGGTCDTTWPPSRPRFPPSARRRSASTSSASTRERLARFRWRLQRRALHAAPRTRTD